MPKGVLDPTTPRCSAHKRGSGERCKLPAIKGGTVCRRHGGSAPQVQRSARERFNDSIDPMINVTAKYIKKAEEGKLDPMEALAWAKFIADRTGFIPGKEIKTDGPAKWEGVLTHIMRSAPPEEVVDAEVVDDGSELQTAIEKERLALEERERFLREEPTPAWADQLRRDDERRASMQTGSADPPRGGR